MTGKSYLFNLKVYWNKIIAREIKCNEYFKTAKIKDIEHYLPAFNSMTQEESQITNDFERLAGRPMTREEIENGFEIN